MSWIAVKAEPRVPSKVERERWKAALRDGRLGKWRLCAWIL